MNRRNLHCSPIVAALAITGLLGCSNPPAETPPPARERIENQALGIAVAALPEAFEVAVNEGDRLVLEASDDSGTGRLVFAIGPELDRGINLIEEVKQRKASFESAAGGEYFGNRELMTPIGTTFSARGGYDAADGGHVEETWIYALHPSANRLLTLTYTYPPGQSQERVGQLVAVLGEVEGIGFRQ